MKAALWITGIILLFLAIDSIQKLAHVVENVMLNLAAVKPAVPLNELYDSLYSKKESMISVELVSAMDPTDDIILHVESKTPIRRHPNDKVDSRFDIPIPQNLSHLYEDLVKSS
jgi:hypothetical protein